MGQLIYGNAPTIHIDDRALAHLQTVIITKLRRDESFSFGWDDEPSIEKVIVNGEPADGPGTIWISRNSSLYFRFDAERDVALNRRWLVELANAANGNQGLRLVPEPA